jgi:uncharacterized protein (DUF488 family)
MSTVVTVGYEGRTVDEFVDALSAARVKTLVDVRLTPISRNPAYRSVDWPVVCSR